ncbi:MAG: hypothetical protein AAGF73_04500 [Actinomycetota bacterium]
MERAGRIEIAVVLTIFLAIGAFIYIQMTRPSWQPVWITAVVGDTSSRDLTVTVTHPRCRSAPRVNVETQTAWAVELWAEQNQAGSCDDVGLTTVVEVQLEDPLSNRILVIDQRSIGPEGVECEITGRNSC